MAARQRDGRGLAAIVARILSCGVIVTDKRHVLIGHATRSPRWDIPKGQADPGEPPEAAARRELLEETGLIADGIPLIPLGRHSYLPRKDLMLYAWLLDAMPDPASLTCRSTFQIGGHAVPEFDRFACPSWADAMPKLGKAMNALLQAVAGSQGWLK